MYGLYVLTFTTDETPVERRLEQVFDNHQEALSASDQYRDSQDEVAYVAKISND
jgi:hypothetical protein